MGRKLRYRLQLPVQTVFLLFASVVSGQGIPGTNIRNPVPAEIVYRNIAAWNGTNWHRLAPTLIGYVSAMAVYDNELVIGGMFASGNQYSYTWRGNGSSWQALGTDVNGPVRALTVHEGVLFVGGDFNCAGGAGVAASARERVGNEIRLTHCEGGAASRGIARWSALGGWQPLGMGVWGSVYALTEFQGDLIVGGYFEYAGDVSANYIARWDGSSWSGMGSGVDFGVFALTVYNDELIAAGEFRTAGGLSATAVARWNGRAWLPLGGGISGSGGPPYVYALLVYHGELIVAGDFLNACGVGANCIARWDGTTWQSLGSGMIGHVYSLAVYKDELIAGGIFSTKGDVCALQVARWDGQNWHSLGATPVGSVDALAVFRNVLILGGAFSTIYQEPPVAPAR